MLRTKTLLMTLLSLIIATKAMAYDAVVNGIYYLLSGTKATVTNDTGAAGSTCYDDKLLITVPETITVGGVVYTVTAVGADAFNGCQSEGVLTLPATIQTIGANAFKEADFDLIELNATTPIAYDQAWFGTDGFKTFFIPGGTKEAYMAAGWPSEGTTLLEKANYFIGSVGYVLHPSTHTATIACKMLDFMKALYGGTLPGFELGDVVVPETITEGGVDYTVTGIDVYAFPYCTMTSISLPNTITELGYAAFGMCAVPSLSIPNSITTITEAAFISSDIDDIYIPESVTKICDAGLGTGEKDVPIKNFHCAAATPPELEGDPFSGVDFDEVTLYVPEASVALYRAADGWSDFINIVPVTIEILTAALVPSDGQYLSFNDGVTNDFSNQSRFYKFVKGSNVVISPYSNGNRDVHLYINGVDRFAELVDGANGEKELHLNNVTEDLLVEPKYVLQHFDLRSFSTKGGTTTVIFINTDNEERNITLADGELGMIYGMKPNTPVTFIFQPEEGYELALVLYDFDRGIGETSDFPVHPRSDGVSYEFVLPAEEFVKSDPSITVFYKKKGADVKYDVNGDSKVTIADVTKLVNIILGKE